MNTLFTDQVISIMPKLRIQALALTRNRAAADDLVQDAICSALRVSMAVESWSNVGVEISPL